MKKNVKMKEIKYTILYSVCEITVPEPLLIIVPVPPRSVITVNYGSGSATAKSYCFLRFLFRNTGVMVLGVISG
jgi:hypothetical protein